MSDRKFRRSDVIARDNREKRVTRISRQRLKGLIEEAVENIINEGYESNVTKKEIKQAYEEWSSTYEIPKSTMNKLYIVLDILGYDKKTLHIQDIPLYKSNLYSKEPYAFAKGLYLESMSQSPDSHIAYSELPNGLMQDWLKSTFEALGFVTERYYGRNNETGKYRKSTPYYYKNSVVTNEDLAHIAYDKTHMEYNEGDEGITWFDKHDYYTEYDEI